MKPKLWKDVSTEEKESVAHIEKQRDELNERYRNGLITKRAWKYNRTMLRKKVDELERKYNENI